MLEERFEALEAERPILFYKVDYIANFSSCAIICRD